MASIMWSSRSSLVVVLLRTYLSALVLAGGALDVRDAPPCGWLNDQTYFTYKKLRQLAKILTRWN